MSNNWLFTKQGGLQELAVQWNLETLRFRCPKNDHAKVWRQTKFVLPGLSAPQVDVVLCAK